MTWIEYLEDAAQRSKDDLGLWVRYLNKVIQRHHHRLSKEELAHLLQSEALCCYQRVFLRLAVQENTLPWQMTVELSEPVKFTRLASVLQKIDQR